MELMERHSMNILQVQRKWMNRESSHGVIREGGKEEREMTAGNRKWWRVRAHGDEGVYEIFWILQTCKWDPTP